MINLANYFENKKIYICSDEFQSFTYEGKIKNQQMKKIFNFEDEMILSTIYRSPKKVYTRLLEMFSPSVQQSSPRDIDSLDLEEIITFNVKGEIENIIQNLFLENVSEGNIIILISGREKKNIDLYAYKNVQVRTVEEFRGMEVPIIIYVITSTSEKDLNEFYVAYSRATTRIIVIIREDVLLLGQSHYEKILIKSPITNNNVKKKIKESYDTYIKDIISSCDVTDVFNNKIYISSKYILLLPIQNKFINTLLIDYLKKQKIPVLEINDNNEKDASVYIGSTKYEHNLKYKLCDKCLKKSFMNNNFCTNCDLEKLNNIDIKSMKKDFSIVDRKNKEDGKSLSDSLRTLGRFSFTSMSSKITIKILDILNKQLNVKYISSIIEFLIILEKMQPILLESEWQIKLKDICNHQDIRILNSLEEEWIHTVAHSSKIFIDCDCLVVS